jgi:hypothetical protein
MNLSPRSSSIVARGGLLLFIYVNHCKATNQNITLPVVFPPSTNDTNTSSDDISKKRLKTGDNTSVDNVLDAEQMKIRGTSLVPRNITKVIRNVTNDHDDDRDLSSCAATCGGDYLLVSCPDGYTEDYSATYWNSYVDIYGSCIYSCCSYWQTSTYYCCKAIASVPQPMPLPVPVPEPSLQPVPVPQPNTRSVPQSYGTPISPLPDLDPFPQPSAPQSNDRPNRPISPIPAPKIETPIYYKAGPVVGFVMTAISVISFLVWLKSQCSPSGDS